jgi:hypothetical protein
MKQLLSWDGVLALSGIFALIGFVLLPFIFYFTYKFIWRKYEFFFRIPIEDLYQTEFKYKFKKFTTCLFLAILLSILIAMTPTMIIGKVAEYHSNKTTVNSATIVPHTSLPTQTKELAIESKEKIEEPKTSTSEDTGNEKSN